MREMKKLRISHSTRMLLASCPRKFEFSKLFPQSKRHEDWPAMVGSALHAAHQCYLITNNEDKATWELIKNFDVNVPRRPHHTQSLEAAYSTLRAIIEHVDMQADSEIAKVMYKGELRPAVEVPFEINLFYQGKLVELEPGIPITYIGYIDDILHNFIFDTYVVEDLKTTTRNLEDHDPVYRFDEQAMPYSLVLSAALGLPVDKLTMSYVTAEIDLLSPKVEAYPYEKDSTLIQDWAKGLLLDLEDIKRFYNLGWWQRRSKSCLAFNRKCKFFDPCATRDNDYLQQFFELGKDLEYHESNFDPWFTLDLELAT